MAGLESRGKRGSIGVKGLHGNQGEGGFIQGQQGEKPGDLQKREGDPSLTSWEDNV